MSKNYLRVLCSITILISCESIDNDQSSSSKVILSSKSTNEVFTKENLHYFNDTLYTGYLADYYFNGALKTKSTIIGGVKQDTTLTYFFTGELKDVNIYSENKLHGEQKGYYPNGTLSYNYTALDGKIEGEYIEYYNNGLQHIFRQYNNGSIEYESITSIKGNTFSVTQAIEGQSLQLMGDPNCR